MPRTRTARQTAFLLHDDLELFYGGSAGGAKSWALLMGALQYVDVPGYSAMIMRNRLTDLNQPDALMDVARQVLSETDAHENKNKHMWTFPSGAQLAFGYLATDIDVVRYRSAAYQYIGIDEVTLMSLHRYRTMFGRLRRPAMPCNKCEWSLGRHGGRWLHEPQPGLGDGTDEKPVIIMPTNPDCDGEPHPDLVARLSPASDGTTIADVPLRMRSASNPGGIGHAFVKHRFIDTKTRLPHAVFLPSRLEDNEFLDQVSYERSLYLQDPVNYARNRFGDWEVRDPGSVFDRNRVRIMPERWPIDRDIERVRQWDLASTAVKEGSDPDYTVGTLLARDERDGRWLVEHVARTRTDATNVETLILQTAQSDGHDVRIIVEEEPGSEGKLFVNYLATKLLPGYYVKGVRSTTKKELRIRVLIPMFDRGEIAIVAGEWNADWLDELDSYPLVDHDDQMDSLAAAVHSVTTAPRARIIV